MLTQDTTLMTFLRSLLALAGTFLIGHAFGGHPITSQLWDTVIGAVLAVVSFITEWKSTNTTPTQWQSAFATALSAIGGAFLAWGVVDAKTWAGIAGVITALVPMFQKQQTKALVMHLSTGKAIGDKLTGAVKKVAMILLILGFGTMLHAQSLDQLKDSAKEYYFQTTQLQKREKHWTKTQFDSIVHKYTYYVDAVVAQLPKKEDQDVFYNWLVTESHSRFKKEHHIN